MARHDAALLGRHHARRAGAGPDVAMQSAGVTLVKYGLASLACALSGARTRNIR